MSELRNTIEEADDDEDEFDLQDDDTCNAYELSKYFQIEYKIADESAVSLKKDYILSLSYNGRFSRLAAGLTNGEVQIFDINGERSLCHSGLGSILAANKNTAANVCGVKFLEDSNADCLLIGTTNGLVQLYDLRTNSIVARFEEEEEEKSKNITCFDTNARVLCTGLEQYQNSGFILFYDIRERKQLGGYFETHQDDVTTLKFHATKPDLLCSGSTDGLINIFDIKFEEDDALLSTINTESSVHKLNWHKNVYEKDVISCITHTNDFKTYDCEEEGDLIAEFDREQITTSMKRKKSANCNLIGAHSLADGDIFLLTGTNFKKGDVLRSLKLQSKELVPFANFDGNKQILRESLFNAKNQSLITAGESGIISLWTPSSNSELANTVSGKLKSKQKLRPHKRNPY